MAEKRLPLRMCCGCREIKNKKELIRVVREADSGKIVIDETGKKNGRGAYVCRNSECLQKAVKKGGLARSLKMDIPDELFLDPKEGNGIILGQKEGIVDDRARHQGRKDQTG